MAVSPYDLEQKFELELDIFEGNIDEVLNKKTIYKGGNVDIPAPKGMTNGHFNILKDRYLSVGWTSVDWSSDQRDGNYLKFKF